MKFIKQFAIIVLICLIGEFVVKFLPFRFPGNIMAMLILAILLGIKILKEDAILETSNFLLETIGLFIVPVSVSIIAHLDLIRTIGAQLLIISLLTLFLTFASCAMTIRLTTKLINKKQKRG